jgi:ribose-phosphate pyrophosphokinase
VSAQLLYATASYAYLEDELHAFGGFERGVIERKGFPDGERYLRLCTPCADRDVVVLGGTIAESDTLEIFDLSCALVEYGARRLTLMLPFYGYSTMERAVRPLEVVTAKTRARLLSAIPPASLGNRVMAVDLHAAGIIHYFEAGVRPVHVYAKPIIKRLARELGGGDFVLACTDAGRAKWVESLANDLGVSAAFVYKRRVDGERTEVTGVSAEVQGRTVVVYDDMIRTGSSLMGAARAYLDAGATRVAAIATHGLFPGDALARLDGSGLFAAIACTNTHPRAHGLRSAFLRVDSVAEILAAALSRGIP